MAWWERAEVGQKIVCRDTAADTRGLTQLVVGAVYTIRAVHPAFAGDLYGIPASLWLCEHAHKPLLTVCGYRERSYSVDCFAPAHDTSIEQFEAMLNPSPDAVREYADELAEFACEELRAAGFGVWI